MKELGLDGSSLGSLVQAAADAPEKSDAEPTSYLADALMEEADESIEDDAGDAPAEEAAE